MDGALPGGNWRCGPACSRWSCAECRTCGSRPSVRRRRWAMMGCRPSGGSTVAPSRPRNCLRGSKDRSACPTGAVPNQSTWSVNLKESQRIIAKNHRKESQKISTYPKDSRICSKNIQKSQRILKNLKIYPKVSQICSKNLKESQRISKNLKESQRISKNLKIYQNISKYIPENPKESCQRIMSKNHVKESCQRKR